MNCYHCGRKWVNADQTWRGKVTCAPCAERFAIEERLQSHNPLAYGNATRVQRPDLYNAVEVATYRPPGTAAEIRERMERGL